MLHVELVTNPIYETGDFQGGKLKLYTEGANADTVFDIVRGIYITLFSNEMRNMEIVEPEQRSSARFFYPKINLITKLNTLLSELRNHPVPGVNVEEFGKDLAKVKAQLNAIHSVFDVDHVVAAGPAMGSAPFK